MPGGCTPGNSRLGAAAYAALAGEASARPRRGGCTPGNSRLWSWSPVGTVQDRPRRQPRRRLNAALAGEASARPRRGVAPRAIRACGPGPRWGPFRTDRGGSRNGGLTPRLWERLAHVRAGGLHPGQFAPVSGGLRRACGRGWRASAPGRVAPQAIRACGPGPRWGPFRTDRGGSRDGGSTPRLWERSARVRAMGFGGARRLEFRLPFTETSQNWGKL